MIQAQLSKIKQGILTSRAAPTHQESRNSAQKAAEDLLTGVISEDEFRSQLTEINYQQSRSIALELARPEINRQLHSLEDEASRQLIADQ